MSKLVLYLQMFQRYLRYYFRAWTRYDVHSPFVFQFVEQVLEDDRHYYAFPLIEQLRWRLSSNKSMIEITDHGAGSKVNPNPQRSVHDIVKNSAIAPSTGRLLFRLLQFIKPKNIIELGTSLGISTAYLKSSVRLAPMVSIEGCPATAEQAQLNLRPFEFNNLMIQRGTFREQLPIALEKLTRLDCLYLDGDHQEGASLEYFNLCLEYAHERSVFIIADIHWSKEMEQAWHQMKSHPEVTLSIDLYHLGLIFFRKENRADAHYTLIKAKYKPWRMGFFGN